MVAPLETSVPANRLDNEIRLIYHVGSAVRVKDWMKFVINHPERVFYFSRRIVMRDGNNQYTVYKLVTGTE